MKNEENEDRETLLIYYPPVSGLIATIEQIQEIRKDADTKERNAGYDPMDYIQHRVAYMRAYANELEQELERRLNWPGT
jgi:hypothetical protein